MVGFSPEARTEAPKQKPVCSKSQTQIQKLESLWIQAISEWSIFWINLHATRLISPDNGLILLYLVGKKTVITQYTPSKWAKWPFDSSSNLMYPSKSSPILQICMVLESPSYMIKVHKVGNRHETGNRSKLFRLSDDWAIWISLKCTPLQKYKNTYH